MVFLLKTFDQWHSESAEDFGRFWFVSKCHADLGTALRMFSWSRLTGLTLKSKPFRVEMEVVLAVKYFCGLKVYLLTDPKHVHTIYGAYGVFLLDDYFDDASSAYVFSMLSLVFQLACMYLEAVDRPR